MTTYVVPIDFPSVQEAIKHATSGDTIEILGGTFDGFNVNKDRLKIIGSGVGKTIILGRVGYEKCGITIAGTQTNLHSLSVRGFQTGVRLTSDNNVIQEVEASYNTNGFTVESKSNLLTKTFATFNQENGYVMEGTFNSLSGNEAKQNSIGFLNLQSNNHFLNNLAKHNRLTGLSFMFGTGNIAFENTVQKNKIGINVTTDHNHIMDNKVCDNTAVGIQIVGEKGFPNGNLVDWNIVRNNGTEGDVDNAGFFVSLESGTTSPNSIRYNKIRNNVELDINTQGEVGHNIFNNNKCDKCDPPNTSNLY
ncbi:hypothetical protein WAK64_07435 [Bacillus spongiae]|uniref:Periplasmic copper-binding protein NosD beta helix domain-containing protein n=1 Tax=Bacillus spongiae TaxID=2683610 RepID=A0ABU8HC94_9BACI